MELDNPSKIPAYVLGAATDGQAGYFLPRERIATFLAQHDDIPLVFHNAAFDLKVLQQVAPDVDVYGRVESNQVWDTLLLHRLCRLAENGHTAFGGGQSTLEACADLYLGCSLPKDVKDSAGNDVRTSYGQYLGRAPQEIEPVYLEYLAKDVLATIGLFHTLVPPLMELLNRSEHEWGFVSNEWLAAQIERWGPQTHHIQLRAAIALDAITANGIGLDLDGRDAVLADIDAVLAEKAAALAQCGYAPGKGSGGVLQKMIAKAQAEQPHLNLARTATGKYETSEAALAPLAEDNPFFSTLQQYNAAAKLRETYLSKMSKPRLHPKFDVLKNTGRTSSFGDINAQNLPRDDRIRRCFVPSQGCVFLDADYATIEMATLALSLLSQFRLDSEMAAAINADKDLHRLVAARVTSKAESDVTKDERAKAKPINFGKPGGMGAARLKDYAKASYGITLSDAEVAALENAWFDLFPEMDAFLGDSSDVGLDLADVLDLTPKEYNQAMGRQSWQSDADDDLPADWLGFMCLKVLGAEKPCTRNGVPYTIEQLDFFWRKAQSLESCLKPTLAELLRQRKPSKKLATAIKNDLGRRGVFTLTGRLRAAATYCARHNTVFQGLAADGAKLALWRLWRAGFKLVNFIHDQVLIEVPEDADLAAVAQTVESIMIESMREVVPDVAVKVEWAYRQRWSKQREDEVHVSSVAA